MSGLAPHATHLTPDVQEERLATLRTLFPEVFRDGAYDPRLLGEVLGQTGAPVAQEDGYSFNWAGRQKAIQAAHRQGEGTLRPDRAASIDFGNAPHLFIEGDNLEVLRLLYRPYHRKVKVIIIDPPYNTGNDFVYPDDFANPVEEYLRWSGQSDESGVRQRANIESGGRFHSAWLNMMYPRLVLARQLLRDDGVIFIAIDDNEVANLRLLCNQVLGEENFVGQIVWEGGLKNDAKLVSTSHDYLLCYARSIEALTEGDKKWRVRKGGLEAIYTKVEELKQAHGQDYAAMTRELKAWYRQLPEGNPAKDSAHYCKVDERGVYFPDNISWPGGGGPRYEILHPVTGRAVALPARGWRIANRERMDQMISQGLIEFGPDETKVPCRKRYLHETEGEVLRGVIYQDRRAATQRLRTLMGADIFDYPKDETVLQKLLQATTDPMAEDVVVDFFAGSGSTGHAVLAQNQADGGNRRFILVQLPEPTPARSDARRAGYDTISEITLARVKKALVLLECRDGVKVLRLADSCYRRWDSAIAKGLGEKELGTLFSEMAYNLVPGRSGEDMLFEYLMKNGSIPLTSTVRSIGGDGDLWFVPDLHTICCFRPTGVTQSLLEAMVFDITSEGTTPPSDETVSVVVALDSAFATDQDKTNAWLGLKDRGIALRTL